MSKLAKLLTVEQVLMTNENTGSVVVFTEQQAEFYQFASTELLACKRILYT